MKKIKQILRKYKFYHSLALGRDALVSICTHIGYFKTLMMLRKEKGLRMSFLYGDHMILQCEETISIKGEARPGEWVTVSIGEQENDTCCQSDGQWEVMLQPLSAGGPYTLVIRTRKKKLVYKDVYAGEVWVCSGQSNMAVPVRSHLREVELDGKRSSSGSTNPPFRYYHLEAIRPTYPVKWNRLIIGCVNSYYYLRKGCWKDSLPNEKSNLSAIAYFYGEALYRKLHKPVGLIVNYVGGASEYCWIERRVLQRVCPEILTDWYENPKVTPWMKGRAIENLGKQYSDHKQLHPYHPAYCFETFVRPIINYEIKGVIWFAGESSAQLDDMKLFEKLQKWQVDNWREAWGKCFPFYYAQLPGINYEREFGHGLHYYYPETRNSQFRILKNIPNSGMIVTCDQMVFHHVMDRRPVGERFARLALYGTYRMDDVTPCGPLFHEALLRENLIYIRFDWSDGLCVKGGGELKTFEVSGEDKFFYPAKAWIEKNDVVLSCPEVSHPYWVRYAFGEYPKDANLTNGDGLPAACFEEQIKL